MKDKERNKLKSRASQSRKRTSKTASLTCFGIVLLLITVSVAGILLLPLIRSSGKESDKAGVGKQAIVTPIGELTLPQQLIDFSRLEETSKGSEYSARFYGMVSDDKVLLFELSVGMDQNGYWLGSAPDTDGNSADIWLNIAGIEKRGSWTEDDFTKINEVQSCVNDIIEQIYQLTDYVGYRQ